MGRAGSAKLMTYLFGRSYGEAPRELAGPIHFVDAESGWLSKHSHEAEHAVVKVGKDTADH